MQRVEKPVIAHQMVTSRVHGQHLFAVNRVATVTVQKRIAQL